MDCGLNNGAGGGARLGLIVLSTDETPAMLAQMDAAMPVVATLPSAELDVVSSTCTSGRTVIGAARVVEQIRRYTPPSQ